MTDTLPPGLCAYCDGHDVLNPQDTVSILRRSGSRSAWLLAEGVNGHRSPLDALKRAADMLRAVDITPGLFVFPDVGGDLAQSLDWYLMAKAALACLGHLDAEPNGGKHWSELLLSYWLKADPLLSITSTSAEAPNLGTHGRLFFLQLEMQNSMQSLAARLKLYPDAVLVDGVFDQPGDPRTVEEIEADLRACQAQARRTGLQAFWSAHTLTPPKADAMRRFVVTTWGASTPA